MPIRTITRFIQHEAFAGLMLMAAASLALIIDNSPLALSYQQILHYALWHHSLQHWLNHGLMTFFFIHIGLEIKRELIRGELNSIKKASLPCFAAIGGMIVPVIAFMAFNSHAPQYWHGWAIPMATDIAFSLGIMTLLGKRCPLALKIFLMTLATFDDLGAIAIIAFFYTNAINGLMLIMALLTIAALWVLNKMRIAHLSAYLLIGSTLWCFMSFAGIDPAIGGIIIAFAIPLSGEPSPAARLEKQLYPWVNYGLLPLFAFANAGINFSHLDHTNFSNSLTLGIMAGLVLGKPIGVLSFSWLAIKWRLAALPTSVNWQHMVGVACLCGVGFTMSLFIGELAFDKASLTITDNYHLGILIASVTAGLLGYSGLKYNMPLPREPS